MSELAVGSIAGLASNGFVVDVASGSQLTQPGMVLQVVSATKTDSFSTTSTSSVDVSDVEVSLTPSSSSSKVFVVISGMAGNTSASNGVAININRDGTDIAQSTGGSLQQTSYVFMSNASAGENFTLSFLDSPNTTSSTTYKLTVRASAGETAYIGRYGSNDNARTVTTITAMEVAG